MVSRGAPSRVVHKHSHPRPCVACLPTTISPSEIVRRSPEQLPVEASCIYITFCNSSYRNNLAAQNRCRGVSRTRSLTAVMTVQLCSDSDDHSSAPCSREHRKATCRRTLSILPVCCCLRRHYSPPVLVHCEASHCTVSSMDVTWSPTRILPHTLASRVCGTKRHMKQRDDARQANETRYEYLRRV
ncbi:hypothetical protein K466DRAFT_293418 [Polyporus arcularius HHB13444]|uniref:Uncharacterized protein n=1 Tax=Polyporus arcularius HHB13444 TaxID=1314778 RepID=A0A5C3PTP1_9APHY|nr:hypothetical protein K466DRAFT_293418 [Polyporus arcularius HHB13444]